MESEKDFFKSDSQEGIEGLYREARDLEGQGRNKEAAEILKRAHELSLEGESALDEAERAHESAKFFSKQGMDKEAAEILAKAAKKFEKRKNN